MRVTRVLRDDIVLGRRLPGSRLVERDLAAELHVSRLPVREAIRRLGVEGIVVSRPRTWAVVKEFTLTDVQELAELREAVESLVFGLAAERADDDGLAQLREILEREERAAATDARDEAHTASGDFHGAVALLAGNAMILEMMNNFGTRFRSLFAQHEDLTANAAAHRGIYEAMLAHDLERVRSLSAEHLAQNSRAAVERLRAAAAD